MKRLLMLAGLAFVLTGCGTKDTVEVSGNPPSVDLTERRLGEGEPDTSSNGVSDWLLCADGSVSYFFFHRDADVNSSGRSFLSRSASSENGTIRHPVVVEKTAARATIAFVGQRPSADESYFLVLSRVDFQRTKTEETVVERFQASPVPAEISALSPMSLVADRWLVWDDSRGATVRLAQNPAEEAARWPQDLGPYRNVRSFGSQILWDTVRAGRVVTQFGLLNEKGEIVSSRNLPPPLVEGIRPVDAQFMKDGAVAWLDWSRDWANLRIWQEGRVRSYRVLHDGDKPVLPFLAAAGAGKFAVTDGQEVRWLNLLDRTSEVTARRKLPSDVAGLISQDSHSFGIFGNGAQVYLRVPSTIGPRFSTIDQRGFRYMTPWACSSHAFGKGAF